MTWEELRRRARARWRLAKDEADWLTFSWSAPPTEAQTVMLARATLYGEASVVFMADVCAERMLGQRVALEENSFLAHAALALHEERYWLRQTLPLDGLDDEALDRTLARLAEIATRLRKANARPDATQLFNHLTR